MNGLSGCKYVLLGGAKIQNSYNCGVHDFLCLFKDPNVASWNDLALQAAMKHKGLSIKYFYNIVTVRV